MIQAARLTAIEELLRERSVLSTGEIAGTLGISAATARRDLRSLDDAGLIERVFGGARLRDAGASEKDPGMGQSPGGDVRGRVLDEPFDEVLARNSEAKQAIARTAAGLIEDGETVFLDAGTTTYELARLLRQRSLTVATNSLGIVNLLGEAERIDLIVLGGVYNREYRSMQGGSVRDGLRSLLIDCAVIGCSGVTDDGEVRDTDERAAQVKAAAVHRATQSVLVADASKFPGTGAFTALSLGSITHIVTDTGLSPELAKLTQLESTEVHTV
ncbi:MAG: DeoR/GlpR family DNA-binding transcription regulator [Acidipropionibacterium sp.]|jgi:DeoR/GlpR family transcriptional regulator of sugar metabolism|nr:DeoR/GlpR family DNA-binding transcription regulator [Acidipropionibacterium sp.]